MLEALLILITLAAAALPAVGSRSWFSFAPVLGLRRGQAGKEASGVLATLLGNVSGCRWFAFRAALARPAPAAPNLDARGPDAMRQDSWPPAPYPSPPGRVHGGSPYAARRA